MFYIHTYICNFCCHLLRVNQEIMPITPKELRVHFLKSTLIYNRSVSNKIKFTLIDYYHLIHRLHSDFTDCAENVLCTKEIKSLPFSHFPLLSRMHLGSHIVCSCRVTLVSFNLECFFCLSLSIMIVSFFEEHWTVTLYSVPQFEFVCRFIMHPIRQLNHVIRLTYINLAQNVSVFFSVFHIRRNTKFTCPITGDF